MAEIKIRGRAKINLSLDVLGKRKDGYHEVQMIMQQIDLYDEIFIKESPKRIVLESNCRFLPTNEENLAYRAARLMMVHYNIDRGVQIYINKKIPVAAGLAGGSTNAAAVMIGLNQLWDLGATKEELMRIALPLGSDIPFCILGGAALAEGIGERLMPIQGLHHVWIVLCKPNIGVSTAEVYQRLEIGKISKHPPTNKLLEAMENKDLYTVSRNLCNVLEPVTMDRYPVVKEIKRKMMEYHALGSLMSGSGPTVFGLYKDYHKGRSAFEKLRKRYIQTYITKTYNR